MTEERTGTIFEELRRDHDRQRKLIHGLVETIGDSDERADLFALLKEQLDAHSKAEERYFYRALMASDLTQDKARHSIHEHEQIDELLEKLETYDRVAPAWLQTAEDLEHRLVHHLDEEEHQVFALAGKVLTDAEKTELAKKYRSLMASEGVSP
ncbi:MAG: hemerythrin domain-containing protein [Acidimicrobiales bacterium]